MIRTMSGISESACALQEKKFGEGFADFLKSESFFTDLVAMAFLGARGLLITPIKEAGWHSQYDQSTENLQKKIAATLARKDHFDYWSTKCISYNSTYMEKRDEILHEAHKECFNDADIKELFEETFNKFSAANLLLGTACGYVVKATSVRSSKDSIHVKVTEVSSKMMDSAGLTADVALAIIGTKADGKLGGNLYFGKRNATEVAFTGGFLEWNLNKDGIHVMQTPIQAAVDEAFQEINFEVLMAPEELGDWNFKKGCAEVTIDGENYPASIHALPIVPAGTNPVGKGGETWPNGTMRANLTFPFCITVDVGSNFERIRLLGETILTSGSDNKGISVHNIDHLLTPSQ